MGEKLRTEKATFGAGCFWHVEAAFRQVKGIVSAQVGYTGGTRKSPSYEDVCSDKTGHAEAVEVEFDPSTISFDELLDNFWKIHDPTTPNRQGPDVGSQYRSAVFFHNRDQESLAETLRDKLQSSDRFKNRKIVTEITPATPFYRAEEYHQRYFEKHRLH